MSIVTSCRRSGVILYSNRRWQMRSSGLSEGGIEKGANSVALKEAMAMADGIGGQLLAKGSGAGEARALLRKIAVKTRSAKAVKKAAEAIKAYSKGLWKGKATVEFDGALKEITLAMHKRMQNPAPGMVLIGYCRSIVARKHKQELQS